MQSIGRISILVRDYNEAIAWYTHKLGFWLIEDTRLSDTKRWVIVSPDKEGKACCLLLAKAVGEEQEKAIGNQSGGRVFLFLYTSAFDADMERMKKQGVEFVRPVVQEKWGRVTVFKDLYGNLWDFIESATL